MVGPKRGDVVILLERAKPGKHFKNSLRLEKMRPLRRKSTASAGQGY